MTRDINHKLMALKRACGEQIYLSLFGIIALLISLVVFWAAFIEGGGLWFGIACLAGAYIGDHIAMRGPWNPLKFIVWGYRPFKRFLRDEAFSKKAEKYGKRILSETSLLPLRTLFFMIPITMILLSLHSTAMDLKFIIGATVWTGVYFAGVVGTVTIPVWYKARDPSRISQFFGIPKDRWEKIELRRPKIHRPPSVTYISVPFLAVGAFGILASVLTIFSMSPFVFSNYNPIGIGLLYVFISLIPLWIGRSLLQMRAEGALAAGVGASSALVIGFLTLIGTLLRPMSFPYPTMLRGLSITGICIAISIIAGLKKNWCKFRWG